MTTRPERHDRAVTLFWLTLSCTACLITRYAADLLGADWRLATALAIGAGLATLLTMGVIAGASGR